MPDARSPDLAEVHETILDLFLGEGGPSVSTDQIEDFESDGEGHVIWTADGDLAEVATALEAALGEAEHAKLVWRPQTTTELDLDSAQSLMRLIEALEEDDDVQSVTANFEVSDEVMAQL